MGASGRTHDPRTDPSSGPMHDFPEAQTYRQHGLAGTPAYTSWADMMRRCYSKHHPKFKHYGGRGIRVCRAWMDPAQFLADMGQPEPGMLLDRIDNNGNYSPENCRWATPAESANNTRRTVHITFRGETLALRVWAERCNVDPRVIYCRIREGWSVERALLTPTRLNFAEGHRRRLNSTRRYYRRTARPQAQPEAA